MSTNKDTTHKLTTKEKFIKKLDDIKILSSGHKQKDKSADSSKSKPTEVSIIRTLPPPNNSQLRFAIYDKSPDNIITALKGNININAPDVSGIPPLLALMEDLRYDPRLPELVERFIEAGANVNFKDKYGDTPLMTAISRLISVDIINILIKAGANVNTKDNRGVTPLSRAVDYLFDPYKSDYIKKEMREIISLLLLNGADISGLSEDKKYEFTRDMMAYTSNENDVQYILRNWMPSDQYKDRLLNTAILRRKWGIIEDLAKMGAIVDFRSIALYDMDNSTLIKLLDLIHPNPLMNDYRKYIFNMINDMTKVHKSILAKPEINDDPQLQYSRYKIKELEEKKLILTRYLYSYLRDLGGYFQPGVLPTDLLKLIGDEIVH